MMPSARCWLQITKSNGFFVTQRRAANKEPPLTAVPFIRVVLTVVVMVTDPTIRNAAQIVTAELALRARARSWVQNMTTDGKNRADPGKCAVLLCRCLIYCTENRFLNINHRCLQLVCLNIETSQMCQRFPYYDI